MWRPFGIRLVSLSNHRDLFQCYSAEGPSQELRGCTIGAHEWPCDIARPCPWARERPTYTLNKEIPHQVGNDMKEVLRNNAKQACYALCSARGTQKFLNFS
ncbi:MAG: hypothetical protein IKR52_02230 [Paludibacteraceae bacterium]|nr:hypothetical protein [Paludibacteraceae bacterium]